jgi:hypothetical protein
MQVIKYQESYSSQMIKEMMPKFFIILGLIILIFVLGFISPFKISSLKPYWWIMMLLAAFIIPPLMNVAQSLQEDLEFFKYGKEGENKVLQILEESLDDNFTYITNYVIPNTRIGDIDGLLIGPKGIVILEIKNYAGIFRISGEDMYRKLKGDVYRLYKKNPFEQIMKQKEYLDKFLYEKGINIKITPIVVLVYGKINAITGPTKVLITEANQLPNYIFELPLIPEWNPELPNKIIQVLGVK